MSYLNHTIKPMANLALVLMLTQFVSGAQYHVAQDGSAGYANIQAAVDAAKSGKMQALRLL